MDAELHFRMPGYIGNYEDESDKSHMPDAILTVNWQRQAATNLKWFGQGICDLNRYGSEDGNNENADEKEEQLQANDGSVQNVEDQAYSTRQCEDWAAHFRPVKYDTGKVNTMGNDVSQAKTLL
jgi:hypothetical protein